MWAHIAAPVCLHDMRVYFVGRTRIYVNIEDLFSVVCDHKGWKFAAAVAARACWREIAADKQI